MPAVLHITHTPPPVRNRRSSLPRQTTETSRFERDVLGNATALGQLVIDADVTCTVYFAVRSFVAHKVACLRSNYAGTLARAVPVSEQAAVPRLYVQGFLRRPVVPVCVCCLRLCWTVGGGRCHSSVVCSGSEMFERKKKKILERKKNT